MLIVVFLLLLLITTTTNRLNCCDLDLGGMSLASLMLIVIHDLFGCDLHVDHCLPFPPSWLQLLTTFLVVMILILVV
jgi:hypothetical protein